jgi:hypothetical protein
MITASKLAIAIAIAGPLATTAAGESFATPVASSAVAVKAAAPAAATVVRYRVYRDGPYAYVPYEGDSYWYPAYPYWDPYTWSTGNGYY